jgi:hypothetical protein
MWKEAQLSREKSGKRKGAKSSEFGKGFKRVEAQEFTKNSYEY